MSHSLLLELLDTGAVWSVARGLACNVEEYKTHLANCDLTRRNDLDGRGTLSEEALAEFTRFFLSVCINQEPSWRTWFSQTASAPEFCCGRKRKSGWEAYIENLAVFSKQSSTVGNCPAETPPPLSAPVSGKPAASSRLWWIKECWFPKALARPYASRSPQR